MEFGNLLTGISDIVGWIQNAAENISSIFSGVDFTILYNWLPNDIVAVITAVIVVLLLLAVFGILRRVLFFLG